ncbi:Spo0E family sporulation regulatory protein-aspartic acid phosphatase [Clostridium sp.]|uniref:Spo0E family sporulation regulatory protein-aspartic acid phosphatase n=1 Tax=Clostridium sp. TaxID=1506 RepID=UPI00261D2484|nr:Spo0E family sporulation regulatory protein-aspartic acid phosphatase [uncultured Clostridium sp.]
MEETFKLSYQQELENSINILRDVLNEMCYAIYDIDDIEINSKRLNVSQQLDILIVKYMILLQ